MFESEQQPSRAMVPAGNGNNGRGRPQGGRGGNHEATKVEEWVTEVEIMHNQIGR